MNVEIWADVVCPWCYIGKRNLEHALDLFSHRDDVTVIWRAFELDPSAPSGGDVPPMIDALMTKYGTDLEQTLASQARVTALAAVAGIDLQLDATRFENSFDAHRIVQLAAKYGNQTDVLERFMRAYFMEGRSISDGETIVAVAVEAGLEEDEVRVVLGSGSFGDDVRVHEATARDLGVRGVPFFVIDRRYAVSGAQPPDVLLDVLQQAWDERT